MLLLLLSSEERTVFVAVVARSKKKEDHLALVVDLVVCEFALQLFATDSKVVPEEGREAGRIPS